MFEHIDNPQLRSMLERFAATAREISLTEEHRRLALLIGTAGRFQPLVQVLRDEWRDGGSIFATALRAATDAIKPVAVVVIGEGWVTSNAPGLEMLRQEALTIHVEALRSESAVYFAKLSHLNGKRELDEWQQLPSTEIIGATANIIDDAADGVQRGEA